MNLAVFNKLVDLAKKGRNISYQRLCDQCNLGYDMQNPDDRNKIGFILGEISSNEHNNGRPLISVLVFRDDKNIPGDGFFELAHRLGLFNGGEDENAKDTYFVSEFKKVCDYWKHTK